MAMRLWHQSFTVLQDLPAYSEALAKRIREVVRPDTEVVLHGQIPGTYSAIYPGTDIEHRALFWMHGLQWIAAAREAEAQGFDAMVLASVPSPMLEELRTLVDIPLVGYGDAAFNIAGCYGRRAGLLLFDSPRAESYEEQLRQWGLEGRFVGTRLAGVTFHDIIRGYRTPADRDEVCGRIIAAAEKYVKEERIDVLVPGPMPMNVLLMQAGVSKIGGATVIDGITTCFKMAETLVDLQRLSGMSVSRRGYHGAKVDPARMDEVMKFYNLSDLGKRIPGEKI